MVDELAAHLAATPAAGSEYVWRDSRGRALSRPAFNDAVWRPARGRAADRFREMAAKVRGRDQAARDRVAELRRQADQLDEAGMHDLRHFYASALIRANLNVKVVSARLGHANAAETLNTYSHLWPDDEDRTRQAIDDVLQDHVPHSRPAKEA